MDEKIMYITENLPLVNEAGLIDLIVAVIDYAKEKSNAKSDTE